MRYNHHFANHFGSCRLLYEGRDPHRNRDIQIRLIPGEFDVVGVTDGVDAWVAPTATAPSEMFDKVRRIIADIRDGKAPNTFIEPRARRQLHLPTAEAPPPRERRRITQEEPASTSTPTPRVRRVITSA